MPMREHRSITLPNQCGSVDTNQSERAELRVGNRTLQRL
jgi:hypothetical protein